MKKVLFILLGMLLLSPTRIYAQDEPPIPPNDLPHLAPAWRLFVVSYDEETGDFTVLFRRTVSQATLFIYKDGVLLDEDNLTNVQAGTTANYNLSFYGSGLFTVYIKIGERTYAVFEEEIEE